MGMLALETRSNETDDYWELQEYKSESCSHDLRIPQLKLKF